MPRAIGKKAYKNHNSKRFRTITSFLGRRSLQGACSQQRAKRQGRAEEHSTTAPSATTPRLETPGYRWFRWTAISMTTKRWTKDLAAVQRPPSHRPITCKRRSSANKQAHRRFDVAFGLSTLAPSTAEGTVPAGSAADGLPRRHWYRTYSRTARRRKMVSAGCFSQTYMYTTYRGGPRRIRDHHGPYAVWNRLEPLRIGVWRPP